RCQTLRLETLRLDLRDTAFPGRRPRHQGPSLALVHPMRWPSSGVDRLMAGRALAGRRNPQRSFAHSGMAAVEGRRSKCQTSRLAVEGAAVEVSDISSGTSRLDAGTAAARAAD